MTISFVAEAHTFDQYAGSISIAKPSGVVNGDVMLACIGGNPSTLSGWTLLGSASPSAGSNGTTKIFYKKASGEGSSYSWTLGSSSMCYGTIVAYRGCDPTTPVDTSHSTITGKGATTNYTTASETATSTQFLVAVAQEYTFINAGSATPTTWSTPGATSRGYDATNIGASGSREEASYTWCDSNGNVSAGSQSQTQTASRTTSGGTSGIILLNDSGVSVAVGSDGVAHATTAAQQPTILIQTVQSAAASTAAHNTSVGLEAEADVADDSTAVAHDALRPMLPSGAQAADVDAETASIHLDVNARLSSAEATAYNASGYYGAAVVRVYVVPDENRTFKVQR